MKHGILIIFLLASAVTAAFAQPKGEIYHSNEFGVRADTIDFGIVLFKNSKPVTRVVTLNNTGTVPLQIAENLYPHFAVQRVNPLTTEYKEFDFLQTQSFPFRVENGRLDSFFIAYTANPDTVPSAQPLGNRIAADH